MQPWLCPEASLASSACTSKLQLQMHLGKKPYEHCCKILAVTPSLCYSRAQLLRHSEQDTHIVGWSSRTWDVGTRAFIQYGHFWHCSLARPGEQAVLPQDERPQCSALQCLVWHCTRGLSVQNPFFRFVVGLTGKSSYIPAYASYNLLFYFAFSL